MSLHNVVLTFGYYVGNTDIFNSVSCIIILAQRLRTQDDIAGLRSETLPEYVRVLFYPCLRLMNR